MSQITWVKTLPRIITALALALGILFVGPVAQADDGGTVLSGCTPESPLPCPIDPCEQKYTNLKSEYFKLEARYTEVLSAKDALFLEKEALGLQVVGLNKVVAQLQLDNQYAQDQAIYWADKAAKRRQTIDRLRAEIRDMRDGRHS